MATVIAVCLVAVYCFRFHFGPSGDEKVSYPPPPPPPPRHPLASTSTTVRICAAIHALRALEPNKPSNAPMPFQLLELDPLAPPFYPPRDSARPGTRYYDAVLREVIEAGKRVRTTAAAAATANQDQDPETRAERTMRAAWFVIDMLLDDEARCAFLDDVQPHLRSWSVATERIERLCGEVWERRQWTL
ncbi:uncharacterized protein LY79DRAFT_594676 [Colletotrichum navitas]|uniref:Uncharacterized protein n=1 Tax=Colletotrichum navitas TaxID=681940 RepID=A0AAD8PLB8_9PEZI|nr:uncharacterized protein LY79DRAFT_594676 [Colletotrichum navitas]KAK1569810.1 hypothetical protein LY79DRAFT_594676 [Colletotrichum navitas]